MKNIVIVGGGISGMIASINLKKRAPQYNIILIEKEKQLGGRLYQEKKNGNVINNGPSWYWMDDIINDIFNKIGIDKTFNLMKPKFQYKIIFDDKTHINIPNNINQLRTIIYNLDPSCMKKYDTFMENNRLKYELCKTKFLNYNNLSITEYFSLQLPYYIYKLDLLSSYKSIINSISSNPKIRQLLEWPSLFIGSNPNSISGLFTFLTYTMIAHGTHIPSKKGMIELIECLENHIHKLNIKIITNNALKSIDYNNNIISSITLQDNKTLFVDKVICAFDYYHMEQLLPYTLQSYPELYWKKQKMCPSSIIFNIILNIKLPQLIYHNLFFDGEFDTIKNPLFYLNITSKFFNEVPDNHENLFILVPLNKDQTYNETQLLHTILNRLNRFSKKNIKDHIVSINTMGPNNFKSKFNAYNGNSYGLGCDGIQIGFMRPKIKSHKVENLYYCGQLSNPGPGIPPCMVSGSLSSNLVIEDLNKEKNNWDLHYYFIYMTHLLTLLFTTKSFKCVWDYVLK